MLNDKLREYSKSLKSSRIIHYTAAGLFAFSAEYITFLILLYGLTFSSVASNVISFMVGLCISFILNKFWTFGLNNQSQNTKNQASIYALLALFNLVVTSLLIGFFVSIGIPGFVAKIALMGMIVAWNFIVFKKIIFKD